MTLVLQNGTVATQFVNSPPPEKHFPVLAGTGAYSELDGAGILVEHGDGTGSLSFSFVTNDRGYRAGIRGLNPALPRITGSPLQQ